MPLPSSQPLMMKGYLAVRLILPTNSITTTTTTNGDDDEQEDDTFLFVREHRGKSEDSSVVKAGCTLFVINAPVIPGISTKILLKSIFGRYSTNATSRVTVIDNPRDAAMKQERMNLDASSCWSDIVTHPTFLPPNFSEGKYAHVVFSSPKDLKKTLKLLQDVMKKKPSAGYEFPGLVLERIEMQTLSDESHRQYEASIRNAITGRDDDTDGDSSDDEDDGNSEKKTGIFAIAERYHKSANRLSRAQLLEECNAVIQSYEDAEEEKKLAQEAAKAEPDEDGFVTVSYSAAVGSKNELDESLNPTSHSRRKGNKRSRGNKKNKKNVVSGSEELKDFYRFQRRDNRKRSLEDLRAQFEEDLKRVKRMKEERQYRPF